MVNDLAAGQYVDWKDDGSAVLKLGPNYDNAEITVPKGELGSLFGPDQKPFEGDEITVLTLDSGPKGGISGPIYAFRPVFEELTGAKVNIALVPISELYTKHKDHGLQVLGLTHFYKNGYMPRTKAETQSGGENVNGMDEGAFLAHVTQFRNVTEMSYPFVIGTEEHFKNYKVQGIPTLVVLDGDHKVVYVSVGAGPANEALLKIAVERLVGSK